MRLMGFRIKKFWRLVTQPYAFFEEVIAENTTLPSTIAFLLALIITYSGWWLVGGSQKGILSAVAIGLLSYPLAVCAIFFVCRIMVRETHLRSFFAVWGFSYLPTLIFFAVNIIAHALAQMPWMVNIPINPILLMGLWSFIFLMFLWKALFLAITLRLAGNLNLRQIIPAFLLLMVLVIIYWGIILKLGLSKVPFI